ncbi:MAG: hypothetical protein GY811_07775 [Myxococcales bacterium]|nr:hypothetical protein [Myxococcales bacterium]
MASLAMMLPMGNAWAQEQSAADETWGEKTPPKNSVRSKQPNKTGHAYNWKQMAYGGLVMAGMGFFIIFLVRRVKRKEEVA